MPSFHNMLAILFAFIVCAFATPPPAASPEYEATVYVTSTIYRVNTVTISRSSSAPVANQTSTIVAVQSSAVNASILHPSATYPAGNSTVVSPTGTGAPPSPPQFTGAASSLNGNAFLAAFAAGLGYLVL